MENPERFQCIYSIKKFDKIERNALTLSSHGFRFRSGNKSRIFFIIRQRKCLKRQTGSKVRLRPRKKKGRRKEGREDEKQRRGQMERQGKQRSYSQKNSPWETKNKMEKKLLRLILSVFSFPSLLQPEERCSILFSPLVYRCFSCVFVGSSRGLSWSPRECLFYSHRRQEGQHLEEVVEWHVLLCLLWKQQWQLRLRWDNKHVFINLIVIDFCPL